MDNLPRFDSPPVVETVLSLQFNRIHNFSNALAGWFWKNFLGSEWSSSIETPRVSEVYEKFGEEGLWIKPQSSIEFVPGVRSERLQIVKADDERMIQVQDNRFIYNWRKRKADYPSYQQLLPEFLAEYDKFLDFVDKLEEAKIIPNQWEVTYVNHIPKGELWENTSHWHRIFPWLTIPPAVGAGQKNESFGGNWKYEIEPSIGRLHIAFQHGRTSSTKQEFIALNLTARGPIDEKTKDFVQGFNIGHESIVRSFTEITSPEAHRFWKRSR